MIKGFLTGRFCPFHKGHEALIEYAKANCDHLTILVGALPDDPIPYKYRLKWVLSTYLDDPQIEVFGDILHEPEYNDSDERSRWNAEYVLKRYGHFDRVFTSEDYGKVFAESMGAENWVFDKSRTIVPVSATMIRTKPLTHWNYINNFAKDYFVKKIAIVVTESTGKTTMAEKLAKHYGTVWCPEAGRSLIPSSRSFTVEDLKIVGTEHAKNIIKHTRLSNKILFIDTDLLVTKSYAKFFFNEVPKFDPWVEKANEVDFYLFLRKDAPYVDDGTRLEKDKRDQLDEEHWKTFNSSKFLKEHKVHNLDYTEDITEEAAYNHRFWKATQIIDKFISQL